MPRCKLCGYIFVSRVEPGENVSLICNECSPMQKFVNKLAKPKRLTIEIVKSKMNLPFPASPGQLCVVHDEKNTYVYVGPHWVMADSTVSRELEQITERSNEKLVSEMTTEEYDAGNNRRAAVEATKRKRAARGKKSSH